MLLPRARRLVRGRRAAAQAYREAGLGEHVALPGVPDDAEPAWHLYVVCSPRADELVGALGQAGVQARAYYRRPLHRQPPMAPFAAGGSQLPVTDELARTNLAVPMSPVLDSQSAEEVVAAIAAAA